MNQEIKDTLAELTRKADAMETFVVGNQAIPVCPSEFEFLTAQRYRTLVRHVEELHKALGEAVSAYDSCGQPMSGDPEHHVFERARKLLNP